MFDDNWQSRLGQHWREAGLDFGSAVGTQMAEWARRGRFFPLSQVLNTAVWFWSPDTTGYRIYQLSLVTVNAALWLGLLASLGVSRRARWVSLALFALLIQVRDYHDPILGFAALYQVSFAVGIGILWSWIVGVRDSRPLLILLSVALSVIGLLLYEITLAYLGIAAILTAVLIGSVSSRSRRFKLSLGLGSLAHVLVVAGYMALVWRARQTMVENYPGIIMPGASTTSAIRALLTYIWQTTSIVPFSYSIFGRSPYLKWDLLSVPAWATGVACAFAVAATLRSALSDGARDSHGDTEAPRIARVLGWSLILIPPLLICLSAKYQEEVRRPGHAYLPIYFAYFGASLLLAGWFGRLRPKAQGRALAMIAVLAMVNLMINSMAIEGLNRKWKYPREAVEAAIAGPLGRELREAQVALSARHPGERVSILQHRYYDWADGGYFKDLLGFAPRVVLRVPYFEESGGRVLPGTFWIDYESARGQTFVAWTRPHSAVFDPSRPEVKSLSTRESVRFVLMPSGLRAKGQALSVGELASSSQPNGQIELIDGPLDRQRWSELKPPANP